MHTLVSFLGRGRDNPQTGYRQVTYRFPDGRTDATAYFGLALARHLAPDRLVLLGTAGSMWDVLVENLPGIGDEDDALRLTLMDAVAAQRVDQPLLDQLALLVERALGRPVQLLCIPFGRDDAEQRAILDAIAQAAPKGEVSLDLTHGFRHLPMLGLLSAFVLDGLGRQVAGLYYGALDMSADGIAPVLRLDGLIAVQRWVDALASFAASGDYGLFAPLLEADGVPADKARCLQEAAFFERTFNVSDAARRLNSFLPALDAPLPGASGLFQQRLRERLAWVRGSDLAGHQRKLAFEHLKRGDYVRAVIFGYEGLLTRLCLEQARDPLNFAERKQVADEFGRELCGGEHADGKREAFRTLSHLRNALAHGTPPHGERLRRVLRDAQALRKEIEACLNRLQG